MNATTTDRPAAAKNGAAAKYQRMTKRGVELLRRNPVESIFSAFAIGLAIGILLPRLRHEPTWRERYVDAPAGKLRGWVGTAVDRSSDALHGCTERSAEIARDTVSAVRKGLGKLRFW
jgi:hypothetical protein